MMTGCRVRGILKTPASISTQSLHLDGVILYAFLKETNRFDDSLNKGTPFPPIPEDFPVKIDDGVPVCTDLMCRGIVHRTSFVKRTSGSDVDYLSLRFHRGGGLRKDKKKSILLHLGSELTWDLIGDSQLISEILGRWITSVGGLRSQGYGVIDKWVVEDQNSLTTHDVWVRDGTSRRSLPSRLFACERESVYLPMKPPYWHRGSLEKGFPAGTKGMIPMDHRLP